MTQTMIWEDLEWSTDAREALERVARLGKPFDAFDLTVKADLREPPNANMWGTVFRQASKDGVIRRVGFHESRRPGRKAGICRVWAAA